MRKIALLTFSFLVFVEPIYSQCAMCKAVAESSRDQGSSIADGLNTGILYLMAFPYILLFSGFIYIYLSKKNTN